MASVGLDQERAADLAGCGPVVIAGINSPRQTVMSGPAMAVELLVETCLGLGIVATRLPVADAFHSPMMADAIPALEDALRRLEFSPLRRRVVSTVTGGPLGSDSDLADLLCRQLTSPVRFAEAIAASGKVDLWIEVGPGEVLGGIARDCGTAPVISLDAGGRSLRGLLSAAGAAFVLGISVKTPAIFADRFTRPLHLARRPRFLANPCEMAPSTHDPEPGQVKPAIVEPTASPSPATVEIEAEERLVGDRSDALRIVRRLIAARTELPIDAVQDHQRLLGDLHLNSITVSQIVVDASRELGLMAPVVPTRYASVTVAEVARALAEQPPIGDAGDEIMRRSPPGIDSWVRAFEPGWVEAERLRMGASGRPGCWSVRAKSGHPLEADLRRTFTAVEGAGTVVVLPAVPDEASLGMLLAAARDAMAVEAGSRFVLVSSGGPWAAFAKSLHLEAPRVDVAVVDVPEDLPGAAAIVAAEAHAALGYSESRYDACGRRFLPVLRLSEEVPAGPTGSDLVASDVLIVTGGGRGIAAECALALAKRTGVRLGLVGRSDPVTDGALAANLRRFQAAGVVFHYARADVTDAPGLRRAVAEIEGYVGPVTAILHAAGVNEPKALMDLDYEALRSTLAPKVSGLEYVLGAVETSRLKVLVTFGSVIARTGMRGEAHYALANAWQTALTERFQARHPACRCLALEWSVWASIGMGERLGRVEALSREGVHPISIEAGTELFLRALGSPTSRITVVVAGRIGDPPTLHVERPALPRFRFLERVLVDYPQVELVAEADLSPLSDPYLNDHVLQGDRLLPAVVGLEAMCQAAAGLMRCMHLGSVTIEDISFERPVTITGDEPTTIRLAAICRGPDRVEVAMRCRTSGYQTDHFRATFQIGRESTVGPADPPLPVPGRGPLLLDPGRDLYATRLFQSGRFRRLLAYYRLEAAGCHALVASGGVGEWFDDRPNKSLLLGDPGLRDAAIHAIQACIPHILVLPIGAKRIVAGTVWPDGPRHVIAEERSHADGVFVYDVVIHDGSGRPCERWEGLRLKEVGPLDPGSAWPPTLVGPYVQRRVRELLDGAEVTVALEPGQGGDRNGRTERAMSMAIGTPASLTRRPDGKPDTLRGLHISSSHAAGTTLAVACPWPVGCDIELACGRSPEEWRALLGAVRFGLSGRLAQDAGSDPIAAATRVWAATESLQKLGQVGTEAVVLLASEPDGWQVLGAGGARIAVISLAIAGNRDPIALAVAVRRPEAYARPRSDRAPQHAYQYRHVVGLEESNIVGNVYFVNHLRWQGRCREMFLRDHAPSLLSELGRDLALVTTRVSCEYLAEIRPFDEILIRMSVMSQTAVALDFRFDYLRIEEGREELVARGKQSVACMKRDSSGLTPREFPDDLKTALEVYR